MNIVTTYRTDASGKGKVTAKGEGKQRTVSYDHSRSVAQNHGDAAGTLARAFWGQVGEPALTHLVDNATATDLGDGKWRFSL